MDWQPGLRMAATIMQLPVLRRFGKTRAFVLSGHENLPHEQEVLPNTTMTRERCALF
jgi:hypothetical protein